MKPFAIELDLLVVLVVVWARHKCSKVFCSEHFIKTIDTKEIKCFLLR